MPSLSLTTRSLLLAVLASFSMALFAKSLLLDDGESWITSVFSGSTFALGIGGLWLGIRGARKQRRLMAWLAPAINGFLIVVFITYLSLLERGLARML